MSFFTDLLPDFSNPDDMAFWGGIGNMLVQGATPHKEFNGMGAGNALALLGGYGMQGATAGAQGAQGYLKSDIENQMSGLGLERQQAIQPYQIEMIKQMMGNAAPGSMAGGTPGFGGGASPVDAQFRQAYALALSTGDMGKAATVLTEWAKANPALAGAIERAKATGGIVQTPNGPMPGSSVPGMGGSAFGAPAPVTADQATGLIPPSALPLEQYRQDNDMETPPIDKERAAMGLSVGSSTVPRDASFMPVVTSPRTGETAQVPPSVDQALEVAEKTGNQNQADNIFSKNKADPSGMPKYKIDPFSKVSTETAGKFADADMKANDQFTSQLNNFAQSEQRLNTIADAFKIVRSGGLATEKAQIANILEGLGIDPKKYNLDDPASVFNVLHENGLNTINQLKTITEGNGFTNSEFERIGNFLQDPDLPPASQLQGLAEAIGTIHYGKAMIDDWNKMGGLGNRAADGYTQRPADFSRQWQLDHKNDLHGFVEKAKEAIGPLKGMEDKQDKAPVIKTYKRINGKLISQ